MRCMDRGNVFSGGAFRVTVYATLVLAIVFVATAIAGYRYLQQEQYEQARTRTAPVIDMYRDIQARGGDAAVEAHLRGMPARVGPVGFGFEPGSRRGVSSERPPKAAPMPFAYLILLLVNLLFMTMNSMQ